MYECAFDYNVIYVNKVIGLVSLSHQCNKSYLSYDLVASQLRSCCRQRLWSEQTSHIFIQSSQMNTQHL